MPSGLRAAALIVAFTSALSCSKRPDPDTLIMVIESSPTNMDPRVGIDAQSERIGMLVFDALLHRDDQFNLQPWLAERWEIPNPVTYVFHLRSGVRFHDGRPLTARDVKWTFDSILQGSPRTVKTGAFRFVDRIEARDEYTVVFRLKEPYATLLWNLSEGAIGIVPEGSGENFNQRPVGSGPFKLVRMVQGKEVVLERNDDYWGEKPRLRRVRFAVVPDTTTRALELRKGSADAAINALTADTVVALSRDSHLRVARGPGTIYQYLAINFNDPLLRDVRVRQALAHAINLEPMLKHLWRGMARPAVGILPPEHWAFSRLVREYPHDPKRARQILHAAGYREKNGVRFRLTIKTSTEEISRLLAAVLQQQLRDVGIALDIRTYEFSTFFSDITKGAFQLYSLRWVGGNEDPDIFEYVFHSSSVPPRRANRGYYSNPKVDALIDEARRELDQQKRKALYAELQRTLAEELPYIHLWYLDNVLVYSQRVRNVKLSPSGNYNFLKTVELTP